MEKKKNTLHNIELWHWSEIKTTHLNVKQFKPGEQNEHAAMLAKEVYMFKMSKDKEKKKKQEEDNAHIYNWLNIIFPNIHLSYDCACFKY